MYGLKRPQNISTRLSLVESSLSNYGAVINQMKVLKALSYSDASQMNLVSFATYFF